MGKATELVYGRQPVAELLRAKRRDVSRLLLSRTARPCGELAAVEALASDAGIPVERVEPRLLDARAGDAHHQGVLAVAAPYPYCELNDVLAAGPKESKRPPLLLILDHVQDPQNLGSVLRTAEAAGVSGVVIPSDRAVGVTPAVVRASAGAAEFVSVVVVTNLVRTMKGLRDEGLWFAGLEAAPESQSYTEADLTGPLGLVVGSEGKGLGRLVRETCDFLVRLPLLGRVASLNAGVATAIALYEILRQRAAAAKAS